MPVRRLKKCLDEGGVSYVSIMHPPAYTAQEVAASSHIPGRDFAKTVIVKIEGRLAMVVAPAVGRLDMAALREVLGVSDLELASEAEFGGWFPECELGAMPPFGNLYDMPVFVSRDLTADEQIAFNAGSHSELVKLAYPDYAALVDPTVIDLGG